MRRRILFASASLAAMPCAITASAQSSTETYTYDSLGRLVSVVTTGGQNNAETQSICYDSAGNRTDYRANASGGTSVCAPVQSQAATAALPLATSAAPVQVAKQTAAVAPNFEQSARPALTPTSGPPVTVSDNAFGECGELVYVDVKANDSGSDGPVPLKLISISRVSGSSTASIFPFANTAAVAVSNVPGDLSNFTYTVADPFGKSATGELEVRTGQCVGNAGGLGK